MAILTISDVSKYAPNVTLTGDTLIGAIELAQSVIESDQGCNRPIEITSFKELLTVNTKTQSLWLSYTPIAISSEMNVKVRTGGNIQDRFRRYLPPSNWMILNSDQYLLDANGQIHLVNINLFSNFNYCTTLFSTAEVVYSAGIDFDTDNSVTRSLKASAGKILDYVVNSGAFQGVTELEVPFDEFRIKYAQSANIGRIPDGYFSAWRKYRPSAYV